MNLVLATAIIERTVNVQCIPVSQCRVVPEEPLVHFICCIIELVRHLGHWVKRWQESLQVDTRHDSLVGLGLRHMHDLHQELITQHFTEVLLSALPVQRAEQQERTCLLVAAQRHAVRPHDVRCTIVVRVPSTRQSEAQLDFHCWVFGNTVELLWLRTVLDVLDQLAERITSGQQSPTSPTLLGFSHVGGGCGGCGDCRLHVS